MKFIQSAFLVPNPKKAAFPRSDYMIKQNMRH